MISSQFQPGATNVEVQLTQRDPGNNGVFLISKRRWHIYPEWQLLPVHFRARHHSQQYPEVQRLAALERIWASASLSPNHPSLRWGSAPPPKIKIHTYFRIQEFFNAHLTFSEWLLKNGVRFQVFVSCREGSGVSTSTTACLQRPQASRPALGPCVNCLARWQLGGLACSKIWGKCYKRELCSVCPWWGCCLMRAPGSLRRNLNTT